MVELVWTDQAIEDIDRIAEYISKDSFKYAKIQVVRFFQATEVLIENPRIGRIVPELRNKSVREVILGNYRIIYKIVNSERVDILMVHHSAKRIRKSELRRK